MAVSVNSVAGLAQAIKDANASTGDPVIHLSPGTYDLSDLDHPTNPPRNGDLDYETDTGFASGLPVIWSEITIVGGDDEYDALASDTIITRTGIHFYRLFYVGFGGQLTLKRLTLTKGDVGSADAGGGAIETQGDVVIEECILGPDNKSNYGGAVLNSGSGTAEIKRCEIYDNEADWGGGLYNYFSGTMNITDSHIHGNSVIAASNGGGIINMNQMTIDHCLIIENTAAYGGGISVYNANAQLTISDSTIRSNAASSGGGGINVRFGNLTIDHSCVDDNSAPNGPDILNDTANQLSAQGNWWGADGSDNANTGGGSIDESNPLNYPLGFCVLVDNVFGALELGEMDKVPVVVGNNDFDPPNHNAIDIVPLGVIPIGSTNIDPDWDQDPTTSVYNKVYAVTDGELVQATDGQGNPIPYIWVLRPQSGPFVPGSPFKDIEFVYVHFDMTALDTSVVAGEEIGRMVNHQVDPGDSASTHLHFGVRTRDLVTAQDPKLAITLPSGVLIQSNQVQQRRFYP